MLSAFFMGERNLSTVIHQAVKQVVRSPVPAFLLTALSEPLAWVPQKLRRKWCLVKIQGQELLPYLTCFN